MLNEELLNKLTECEEGKKLSLWQICENAMKFLFIIESEEDKLSFFRSFLEWDIADLREEFPDILPDIPEENIRRYEEISSTQRRIMLNLLKANPTEDAFYRRLWDKWNDQDLFSETEDRIALLLCFWRDVRIPYFHLSKGLEMQNKQYQKISEDIKTCLEKARFIIFSNQKQRTQITSLLLELADSLCKPEEQAVFWSYAMEVYGNRLVQIYKQLEEEAEENS